MPTWVPGATMLADQHDCGSSADTMWVYDGGGGEMSCSWGGLLGSDACWAHLVLTMLGTNRNVTDHLRTQRLQLASAGASNSTCLQQAARHKVTSRARRAAQKVNIQYMQILRTPRAGGREGGGAPECPFEPIMTPGLRVMPWLCSLDSSRPIDLVSHEPAMPSKVDLYHCCCVPRKGGSGAHQPSRIPLYIYCPESPLSFLPIASMFLYPCCLHSTFRLQGLAIVPIS